MSISVNRHERVRDKAYQRAQRRFHLMLLGGELHYGVPEVLRYIEAERLVDRLEGRPEFSFRPLSEAELDALHEGTHASLADLAATDFPLDIPAALDIYWNRGA